MSENTARIHEGHTKTPIEHYELLRDGVEAARHKPRKNGISPGAVTARTLGEIFRARVMCEADAVADADYLAEIATAAVVLGAASKGGDVPETMTLPFVGVVSVRDETHHQCMNPHTWVIASALAAARKNQSATHTLLTVDIEALDMGGRTPQLIDVERSFAKAWRHIVTESNDWERTWDDAKKASVARADDQPSARRREELIRQPQLDLLRALATKESVEDTLWNALNAHKEYWDSKLKLNRGDRHSLRELPDGHLSLPLLGLAAESRRRGYARILSTYTPEFLFAP